MNEYLNDYVVGVQASGVSGFEHLHTLLLRDKLYEQDAQLDAEEKAQLLNADQRLLQHSPEFLVEIERITTLEYERSQRQSPPERWWWYLDVIIHLPNLDKPEVMSLKQLA